VAAVRDWLEQDVMFADPMREPMSALVWTEAGFTPQEAASWHGRDRFHASFTPDLAAEFADGGWSPAEASLLFALASRLADVEDIVEWAERWIRTNLDPGDVLDFAWAGVNPTEGSTLARWNNKQHLDEELRAREEHLQNLAIGGVRGGPRALRRVAAQQVRRPRS
jgi:hypothetical protein